MLWNAIILCFVLSFIQASLLKPRRGVAVFKPCENGIVEMQRHLGSQDWDYWNGIFFTRVYNHSENSIRLQLTAPAEITMDPEEGKVYLRKDTFYMDFYPNEEKLQKMFKFHVQGEQGGIFPNIKKLILNGVDVCPNPQQWDSMMPNHGNYTNVNNTVTTRFDTGEKSHCGKRLVNHQVLIKGGELTRAGDWPWHVALFHQEGSDRYAYKCGGTLINTNTVLTAAHCVTQTEQFIVPDRVLVKLGLHHRFISGRNAQEFQVYKIIPHENFNFTYLYNDIAILKLATEAMYTNYVQPVCLWPASSTDLSDVVGKPGDVIGWGFNDKENKVSEFLGYATMPIVSTFACLESNRAFFGLFVSNLSFCAGYRNGTSVCNGDSGGGMFLQQKGVYLLRGIVSVSVSLKTDGVCDPYEHVIFTDVAQYLDWIKKNM